MFGDDKLAKSGLKISTRFAGVLEAEAGVRVPSLLAPVVERRGVPSMLLLIPDLSHEEYCMNEVMFVVAVECKV